MRKILSLIAVMSMTLAANAKSSYQGDYSDWGKLKIVGNQLSDKNGNPVQLKGWSTYSLHYGEVMGCLGQGQWKLMQEYGANVVRLAMYIAETNSYLSDPSKFKDFVKKSIKETKELDMYCIVDWHTFADSLSNGDPNDYIAESKDFFSEISKYCADNGYDNVLYEICSEPACGWNNIKSYAEEVVPMITANQPDAMIIVGTDGWSQKVREPVSNPIDSLFKKNVMYSFHYDACSHYNLLGEFRAAQKDIPVFVSEWSAFNFDGDGLFCKQSSDELMAACENTSVASQLVSWCIWNWGKKGDAPSFFIGSCDVENESKYTDESGSLSYSYYVKELMNPTRICCTPPPCCGPWGNLNTIPSTAGYLWNWDYYDYGGEGVAYHDVNKGAYKWDENGNVVDYSNEQEEVDVFSLAKKMMWIDKECPWSTVEGNKVVAFDSTIATMWKDEKGNPTYKSLNAGRMYYGTDGSLRPDDGVDLTYASLKGTLHAGEHYTSLGWVEKGEWINYTVDVNKAGYYKIKGVINSEYSAPVKNGEISITSQGHNLLRSSTSLADADLITAFGFPIITGCADPTVKDTAYWDCWAEADAVSGKYKEVLCMFPETGLQEINISFSGNAGGVGPLTFEFYEELNPEDPIVCGDCGGWNTDVNDANATKFSINPNPTSGEFSITLADNIKANVEIINMAGQIVVSQGIEGSATINKILPAGVYTVIVKSNGAVNTQKLVVK